MKLSDALKLFDNEEEDSSIRKECLITRQEIKNEIVLKCNHSFEYNALLKHLLNTQSRYEYHKCPYCRCRIDNFIPYYQIDNNNDVEINKNIFKKNNYITCSYCFVSGKNKGTPCGKVGHKFKNGEYCHSHYKQVMKNEEKNMLVSKNKIIVKKQQCCKILKNGNQCKLNCFNIDTGLCKRHGGAKSV